MSSNLKPLERSDVIERLGPLDEAAVDRLLAHYDVLRRWARRLSLIGPGTVDEVVERHYRESLAGAPLVHGSSLLDIGSGAGFPGLVLAAVRPDLRVALVERRQRKAAFLRAAARKMGLEVRVLEGDLARTLPQAQLHPVDSVTLRAVRLEEREWSVVSSVLAPQSTVILWEGTESPALPAFFRQERAVELADRTSRIVSYRSNP